MKIKLPGLCEETTAAGNPRWRVRTEGKNSRKVTLRVPPGHPDFFMHYEAARRGEAIEEPVAQSRRGSLHDLKDSHLAWLQIQVQAGNYDALTLQSRRTGLEQACACPTPKGGKRMGMLSADLPKEAFYHIRDSFGAKTAAAATCLKALRAAYKWGEGYGFPARSPVFEVKSTHVSKGGATPWTLEDEERFLGHHRSGSMARLWYLLARDTAARIGDIFLLGPKNLVESRGRACISWQPKKKGSKPVTVPISDELVEELAKAVPGADRFLLTANGRPFASSGSLDNRVRDWVTKAGLVGPDGKANRSQHGIRKRTAEEIAMATGSVYAVMATLSHSDPKTAATYTAKIDREEAAAKGVESARARRSVPRPLERGTHGIVTNSKVWEKPRRWQPVGESNPSFQVENLAS